MDIKQMKAFVSEELKGLKQEHRLLSMRGFCCSSLRNCGQTCVPHCPVSFSDISASESIMKTKTSQDFQELLRIEHCRSRRISILTLTVTMSDLILPCCSFTWRVWYSWMYFLHRGAHHKTGAFDYQCPQSKILKILRNFLGIFFFFKRPFSFSKGLHNRKYEAPLSSVLDWKWWACFV